MAGTDREEGETLTVHVLIDENNMPSRRYPYAGWRGTPGSNWCWPIVISPNGKVDHGSPELNEPKPRNRKERFSLMDFYDRALEEGGRYVMSHNDGSRSTYFVITKVDVEKY